MGGTWWRGLSARRGRVSQEASSQKSETHKYPSTRKPILVIENTLENAGKYIPGRAAAISVHELPQAANAPPRESPSLEKSHIASSSLFTILAFSIWPPPMLRS